MYETYIQKSTLPTQTSTLPTHRLLRNLLLVNVDRQADDNEDKDGEEASEDQDKQEPPAGLEVGGEAGHSFWELDGHRHGTLPR